MMGRGSRIPLLTGFLMGAVAMSSCQNVDSGRTLANVAAPTEVPSRAPSIRVEDGGLGSMDVRTRERLAELEKRLSELDEQILELQQENADLHQAVRDLKRLGVSPLLPESMESSESYLGLVEVPVCEFRTALVQDVIRFVNENLENAPERDMLAYLRSSRERCKLLSAELVQKLASIEMAERKLKEQFLKPSIEVRLVVAGRIEKMPVITFSGRYISLQEIVETTASIADLKCESQGSLVLLKAGR